MSLLSKISELPRAPQPPVAWKVLWITFVGSMVGIALTAFPCF